MCATLKGIDTTHPNETLPHPIQSQHTSYHSYNKVGDKREDAAPPRRVPDHTASLRHPPDATQLTEKLCGKCPALRTCGRESSRNTRLGGKQGDEVVCTNFRYCQICARNKWRKHDETLVANVGTLPFFLFAVRYFTCLT